MRKELYILLNNKACEYPEDLCTIFDCHPSDILDVVNIGEDVYYNDPEGIYVTITNIDLSSGIPIYTYTFGTYVSNSYKNFFSHYMEESISIRYPQEFIDDENLDAFIHPWKYEETFEPAEWLESSNGIDDAISFFNFVKADIDLLYQEFCEKAA